MGPSTISAHGHLPDESERKGQFGLVTKKDRKEKELMEEERVMFFCTHSIDNLEVAAIPFVMGAAALAMDLQADIVLQADAVYLAKKGFLEILPSPGGFNPFPKLMSDFLELGGKLKVCVPCIKDRNIKEDDLIEEAELIAAGNLIDMGIKAKAVFTY